MVKSVLSVQKNLLEKMENIMIMKNNQVTIPVTMNPPLPTSTGSKFVANHPTVGESSTKSAAVQTGAFHYLPIHYSLDNAIHFKQIMNQMQQFSSLLS
jgi:hypothetical protein